MKGLINSTVVGIFLMGISWTTIGQPIPATIPSISVFKLSPLDNTSLKEKETQRRMAHLPPHFAAKRQVNLKPSTHGQWVEKSKDTLVWSLKVQSPGAFSLNLGFSAFKLPQHAQFYLIAPSTGQTIGPLTANDNDPHNQFFSPAIEGDELILQLQIPQSEISDLELQVSSINHDFTGLHNLLQTSQCQVDIACDEATPFQDIAQSVGLIGIDGVGICTGFLVNNTAGDCRPYFITAQHCDINSQNAPSVVVYWNYQNSYCRTEEETGDGSLLTFNSGTIWRAGYSPSDFCLLELDDPVHPEANAFFAGWNRNPEPPNNLTFSIHHPDGSEKSLALNHDGTEIINYELGDYPDENGNHLMVANWELGTTEYGSSGAPLFDDNQLVVGQLHGGLANCGNTEYDAFGWWFKSWEGGGTPSTALKYWLDPLKSEDWTLEGQFEKDCGYHFIEFLEYSTSLCGKDTISYTFQLGPEFKVLTYLSLEGLPNEFGYYFFPNSAVGGDLVSLFIFSEGEPSSQQVRCNLIAANSLLSSQLPLTIEYASALRPPPNLEPAESESIAPLLTWHPYEEHLLWELELLSNNLLVTDTILSTNEFQSPRLNANAENEWRVRVFNECGYSEWSEWATWTTPQVSCSPYDRIFETPQSIPDHNQGVFTDSITIEEMGSLVAVSIHDLSIRHSFIGDLTAWLQSPAGTKVLLFDQPGVDGSGFGCPGENLEVNLDDFATATYTDFNNTCGYTAPAISGDFQPKEPLGQLRGENPKGYWKLIIKDQAMDDFGSVEKWSLELCIQPTATSYFSSPSEDAVISFFPNPTIGKTIIKAWPTHDELQMVHIYATDGQLVQTISMESGQREIDLSTLTNGTYFCQLKGQKTQVYRKIILLR